MTFFILVSAFCILLIPLIIYEKRRIKLLDKELDEDFAYFLKHDRQ